MRTAIAALLLVTSAALAEDAAPVGSSAYLAARAKHVTKITKPKKPPATFDPTLHAPRGVEEIKYPSGDLSLKAWFAWPYKRNKDEKVPGLVYFHAGFAFHDDDWANVKPFREAGFAVLCPTLRAENGNPGRFEMFYGEIDDARAAIRWLAAKDGVDPERVFAFGHSVGGAVSALISLYDEPKVLLSGSCGGLFPRRAFQDGWEDWAPFGTKDKKECELRILVANFADMRHRHLAYIGREDDVIDYLKDTEAAAKKAHAPLEVEKVPGTHMGSLQPAIKKFIKRALEEPVRR